MGAADALARPARHRATTFRAEGNQRMHLHHRRDLRREKVAEASRLLRMAYALQVEGELDRALALYEKSLRLHATAEAHAYLGWALSTRGEYEEAVAQCVAAIALDPEYANAWNDIGAYRIQQGRPDDALFFLKRATRIERQPSRAFPHYNLHRAYLDLGDRPRAIEHLQASLDADPDFTPALDALSSLLFPDAAETELDEEVLASFLAGSPVLVPPAHEA